MNNHNEAKKICNFHHFADDTNPLCPSNSIKKLDKIANAYLNHLINWLNANKILLNVKKLERFEYQTHKRKSVFDLRFVISK